MLVSVPVQAGVWHGSGHRVILGRCDASREGRWLLSNWAGSPNSPGVAPRPIPHWSWSDLSRSSPSSPISRRSGRWLPALGAGWVVSVAGTHEDLGIGRMDTSSTHHVPGSRSRAADHGAGAQAASGRLRSLCPFRPSGSGRIRGGASERSGGLRLGVNACWGSDRSAAGSRRAGARQGACSSIQTVVNPHLRRCWRGIRMAWGRSQSPSAAPLVARSPVYLSCRRRVPPGALIGAGADSASR